MTAQAVAVTGATGFVGQTVCHALREAGQGVVALGRRPVDGFEWRAYDLAQPIPDELLAGVDAVVHCAYDLSLTDADAIAEVNVQGGIALAGAAQRAGTRSILISSMSAYPGTRQIYGRAKLASEATFLSSGGEAVRLGLVWGGAEGGMIGTLARLSRLPVVPRLGGHCHQFAIHAEDMASGLVALISRPRLGVPIGLAHPSPVPFDDIIGNLRGSRPLFFPVPWRPVYASMRIGERLGLPLPVRADSLLGLVRPASAVPNVDAWTQMGVSLRPFGRIGADQRREQS